MITDDYRDWHAQSVEARMRRFEINRMLAASPDDQHQVRSAATDQSLSVVPAEQAADRRQWREADTMSLTEVYAELLELRTRQAMVGIDPPNVRRRMWNRILELQAVTPV